MFGFCKHDWQVLSKTLTPSRAEDARKDNITVTGRSTIAVVDMMYSKNHIEILTCKKCGKLTRYVTEI